MIRNRGHEVRAHLSKHAGCEEHDHAAASTHNYHNRMGMFVLIARHLVGQYLVGNFGL